MNKVEKLSISTKHGNINGDLYLPLENFNSLLIIAHGFRGSKDETHISELFEYIGDNKFGVFKFDFGNGDGTSYGNIKNLNVSDEIHDMEDIVEYFKNHSQINSENISLYGHSLGGFVIAQFASKRNDLHSIILSSAVFDFQNRARQLFGEDGLKAYMTKDIEGIKNMYHKTIPGSVFDVGVQFFLDLTHYSSQSYSNISCPTLIINCENDKAVRADAAGNYNKALECLHELKVVHESDHTFTEQRFRNELNSYVLEFLAKYK